MRVLFWRSNPVDPDSRVEKQVNSLNNAGYQVKILAWDRNGEYDIKETIIELEAGNVKINRFGIPATYGGGIKKNLVGLMKFQWKLFIWLIKNRNSYDILHACDFDTAFIANIVSILLRKKLIYDIFDYYVDAFKVPKKIKKIITTLDHNIINRADAVIVCTEKRIEQIKGTYPKKLVVIHNTPAQEKFEMQKLNLNPNKIKLVYVGILGEGRFIKEIIEFVKENQEFEFHIGGFGEFKEEIERIADDYENIFFYGKIPYSKTLELENSCDIMTAIYDPKVPNHYYAAPNKFYEALMLGKPLIMVKNTGMDEVIAENNIGAVIDYDGYSLKEGVDKIVGERDEWEIISKKMISLYERNYNWDEMELRVLGLYDSIRQK